MKHAIFAAGVILGAGLAHMPLPAEAEAARPELTIYTYDSFVSEWGPGPAVEVAFEENCDCDLRFVVAGDGAALLSRLRLEGPNTEADLVLGLDTNLIAQARETGLFQPHGQDMGALTLPVDWGDETFLPFDWGYLAFVHRTDLPAVPSSFRALAESDTSIIIQDPRSSTPGLALVMWVEAAYGDAAAEIWADLADNILTVTPGWSEAYVLFLEGEADMVLSYTTSPAYHLIAEEDDGFASAAFEEGHYMQIELAAILAGTDQPDLAQDFLEFMLSVGFQSLIPTTNWMYPAALPEESWPDGFQHLTAPDRALLLSPEDVAARRDAAVGRWQDALSR